MFSLVSGLPPPPPAAGPQPSFGCFAATTPRYDSPPPCIRDLSLLAFSQRSVSSRPRTSTGSLGSRAWSFYACLGSSTPQGRDALAMARTAVLPSVLRDAVGALDSRFRSSQLRDTQPAYTPVQRFQCGLATALTWLGARMVRYSFPVGLFPSLLHAGLSRRYPRKNARAPLSGTGCARILIELTAYLGTRHISRIGT